MLKINTCMSSRPRSRTEVSRHGGSITPKCSTFPWELLPKRKGEPDPKEAAWKACKHKGPRPCGLLAPNATSGPTCARSLSSAMADGEPFVARNVKEIVSPPNGVVLAAASGPIAMCTLKADLHAAHVSTGEQYPKPRTTKLVLK